MTVLVTSLCAMDFNHNDISTRPGHIFQVLSSSGVISSPSSTFSANKQQIQSQNENHQQPAEKPPPRLALPQPSDHADTAYKQMGRPLPFPYKLHNMLKDVEKDGKEHIVSWVPSGRSFKVHNSSEFVNQVVPFHFNLTKYKSFKRQLLNYGFMRLESGQQEDDGK
jgi:hypothetical protein